jgi:hypothetical protein
MVHKTFGPLVAPFLAVWVGCGSSSSSPSQGNALAEAPQHAGAGGRPKLTSAQCEAQGGSIVNDIGNGAIHQPDYVCPSGKPPLGDVTSPPDGPRPVEGAVCCPR